MLFTDNIYFRTSWGDLISGERTKKNNSVSWLKRVFLYFLIPWFYCSRAMATSCVAKNTFIEIAESPRRQPIWACLVLLE